MLGVPLMILAVLAMFNYKYFLLDRIHFKNNFILIIFKIKFNFKLKIIIFI